MKHAIARKGFLILSLAWIACGARALAQEPAQVYVYQIDIHNAHKADFDSISGSIARILQRNGLSQTCVDLRSLGENTQGSSDAPGWTAIHETIGVVLMKPIPG